MLGMAIDRRALSLVCGTALVEVCRLLQSAPTSPLIWLGAVGSAVAGVACAALALGPSVWWQTVCHRLSVSIAELRSEPSVDVEGTGRCLMLAGALTFVLLAIHILSLPIDPADDDQGAYLETARQVQQAGGISGLVRNLYAGDFAEANRHPLYIGLLSLQPTVPFGRTLSAAGGLATLLLLTWLAARRWGTLTGGLLCVLLASNLAFLLFSTRVVCDVLMVLWGGLIWLLYLRRRSSPAGDLGLGVLTGLAWLTKGTGLLLLAGVIAVSVWEILGARPERRHRVRGLALMLAAWLATCSPLLVRNITRFGTPFYNVNTWLLFTDQYEDPLRLAAQHSVADAAKNYLGSHSLGEIATRELSGLAWEAFILLRSLGPSPMDDSRVLPGAFLGFLCVMGLALIDPPGRRLLGIWGVLFLGFFAWYVPVAAGERFLLPLLAPLLMCASVALSRLATVAAAKGWARNIRPGLVMAALAWCLAWGLATWLSTTLPSRVL